MGEKIRDIREINLIGEKLMVELNKGTTNNPEDLIHIQNKKFRYLLTVTDFMKLSAHIMRADKEFEYIKTHLPKPLYIRESGTETSDTSDYRDLLEQLSKACVNYRIISVRSGLMTVIIKPSDKKKAMEVMKRSHFKKLDHPYGKKHGFGFLYKMHEFSLFSRKNGAVEVFYELPSLSMTPKKWIPLDLHVQAAIWENSSSDTNLLDDESAWIYRMCLCIFTQVKLYEDDIEYFKKNKEIPFKDTIRERLELVFFGFTDRLLELLKNEKYEDIVETFYTYREY